MSENNKENVPSEIKGATFDQTSRKSFMAKRRFNRKLRSLYLKDFKQLLKCTK